MSKKEIKEMSKEELLDEIKAASNAELYGNVDEPVEEDDSEQNKQRVLDDFAKFTRVVRRYKKTQAQMRELVTLNKDNEELQKYVKLLDKLAELENELDEARKGYLYDSAILAPKTRLENVDVKISLTLPHTREDFDKVKFIEDYGSEKYKEYITTKDVKGNIKYKIKE